MWHLFKSPTQNLVVLGLYCQKLESLGNVSASNILRLVLLIFQAVKNRYTVQLGYAHHPNS